MKNSTLFSTLLLLVWIHALAQAQAGTDVYEAGLSQRPELQISYITVAPSEEEPYTVYGHAGLRVFDAHTGTDLFYDYGNFSFEQPGFLSRFVQGRPLYQVDVKDFQLFLEAYRSRGSAVREQVLRLSPTEAARVLAYLQENLLPENREYLYNFIFDNCANRPLIILQQTVGPMRLAPQTQQQSYREELRNCTLRRPWQQFGTNLALGYHADRLPEKMEEMFLPSMAHRALQAAQWATGSAQSVVAQEREYPALAEGPQAAPSFFNRYLTPSVFFGLLFFAYLLALIVAWRMHAPLFSKLLESLLCLGAGLAGVLLWYIGFFSEHPFTFPNLNLLLLHPFYLLLLPLIWNRRSRNPNILLHLLNFAVLLLYIILMLSCGQSMTSPIYWLFLSLLMVSGKYALVQYMQKKKQKRQLA